MKDPVALLENSTCSHVNMTPQLSLACQTVLVVLSLIDDTTSLWQGKSHAFWRENWVPGPFFLEAVVHLVLIQEF